MKKPQKETNERLTTELILSLVNKNQKTKNVRCLLDTGTTKSIVLSEYMSYSQKITKTEKTKWQTLSGTLTTHKLADMQFIIPGLNGTKQITWPCHVDATSIRTKSPYDVILGTDFLTELKIVIDFATKTIKWDNGDMSQ